MHHAAGLTDGRDAGAMMVALARHDCAGRRSGLARAISVEPSLNRVTGPNGVTRLEPKVMLVLACLADHAGRMVPKDRLLHAAWPDTAVGDDVLTRAISELRRLFEDDPKQPRIIETIPKSGYRLIAPVAAVAVQREATVATPSLVEPRGVAVAADGAHVLVSEGDGVA